MKNPFIDFIDKLTNDIKIMQELIMCMNDEIGELKERISVLENQNNKNL